MITAGKYILYIAKIGNATGGALLVFSVRKNGKIVRV
jgi:hypothetical protein